MSNTKFAFTFYWQEIFPDYDTFKTFIYTLNLYNPITDSISEEFNQYIYGILSRQYYNNNVRYDSIEAFKMAFATAYINNFQLLKKRKELLNLQYGLTATDFEIISKSLVNSAYNPNNVPEDPLQPIDYVSAQNYSVGYINKLNAYIQALNSLQDLDIEYIIRKFDYLFIQELPESEEYIIYEQ